MAHVIEGSGQPPRQVGACLPISVATFRPHRHGAHPTREELPHAIGRSIVELTVARTPPLGPPADHRARSRTKSQPLPSGTA